MWIGPKGAEHARRGTRQDTNTLQALRTKTFSSVALIVAVAVFAALATNGGFYSAAISMYGGALGRLPLLASLPLVLSCIFVLLLSALCHRWLVKPVLIVFLLLSAVFGYFAFAYGTIFDPQMIANALQTDSAEAGDLINLKLVLYIGLLGVLPSIMVAFANLAYPGWKSETIARLRLVGAAGATLAVLFLLFGAHYVSLVREHRELTGKIAPLAGVVSAIKLVSKGIAPAPDEHTIVGADARISPEDTHRELIIMVVGETARADHWGLNGYSRQTTPLLKGENVINYPDFWSCDTSTARSVPCMFSNLGRAKFDVRDAQTTDNALDILKRAGVSVLWRDNNSSSKGVADRVLYQDFKSPALNPMCEDGECRDEGMLSGLQEHINAQSGDVLIVLHQMGNHGPAYYKRYPKSFERFTPVCKTNDLGSCTAEEITNAYDNAILYTDHFLGRVIALLKANTEHFETAMLYVSDHGESLGEYGMYLHGTPYMLAPDTQKHVPAVVWYSNALAHDLRVDDLAARSKRRWTHDSVFHTLLGLFEIRSNAYDPTKDLLVHNDDEAASVK